MPPYITDGKLTIEECENIEAELPEVCQLIRENPEESRRGLLEQPAATQHLPTGGQSHRTWQYLWQLSHGIDPLSRSKKRTAIAEARQVSPEKLQRRQELQRSDAYMNNMHPDHTKVYGEWLNTFSQNGNGEQE